MSDKKQILIVGKDSYIGEHVREYLERFLNDYNVSMLDSIGLKPEPQMFINADTVIHTAGIAHIKETKENRHLYYEVNRDLAVNTAKAAKEAGVRYFILFSSMSVYGKLTGEIRKEDKPVPSSAYGDSKLQADEAIRALEDDNFQFACVRPPMVYGKGCKGNYNSFRKIALGSPLFPDIKNERSMIYIGNLCVFIRELVEQQISGLFFPQNAEYMSSVFMAKEIANYHGKKLITTRIFNPLIKYLPLGMIKKAFGSLTYEMTEPVDTYNLTESLHLTEDEE